MKEIETLENKIDVLRTDLVKEEDLGFLQEHRHDFEERFTRSSLFRSKFEMEASVLNDDEHPTPDSKYWQAIGEQSVHLRELISLSYESKKLAADNELLETEIEELESNILKWEGSEDCKFDIRKWVATTKKKKVELDQNKFGIISQLKVARERMKEIRNWENIIAKLKPQLQHGDEDWEAHHPERYYLRYQRRMQRMDAINPQDREQVLSSFQSFERHFKGIETGLETKPALISTPSPVISHQLDFKSKEEMVEKNRIAKTYFDRKVRKIVLCSPHRVAGDKACTNFSIIQPPAAFDVMLEEPYGYSVPDARNFMVDKAIKEGFNYIFFIDDDLIIPRLALVRLLYHDVDIVGGFYYRKYVPLESVGMHFDKEGFPAPIKDYKIGEIIHNTLVLPSGCTLIKVDMLKKMEFPWYESITVNNSAAMTEDTYLCQKAREVGADILTDTGIQCIHVDKERGVFYGHPDIVQDNVVIEKYREVYAV